MNQAILVIIMLVTIGATLMGIAGIIFWWTQTRGRWISSPYSRWVMTFLFSGSLLAGTSTSRQIIGPWPGSLILILASWIGLCVALSWPLLLWWKSRKEVGK